ncbi:glycosyltransferase [Brevundimonas sp.]|uniref:glycosyltransferase n=1 Tax=Brevundimonas sp. TaxID=1871086 RepID=UPI0037BEF20B
MTTGFAGAAHRVARREALPLVQTLRDYSTICSRGALFRNGRRCALRCLDCVVLSAGRRRDAAGVAHVAAVSAAVLAAHRAAGFFPDAPATIIGNAAGPGVVVERGDGPPTFGFIGRIEPEKGIEVLLRAAVGLDGDWRLRIAGRGEPAWVEHLKRSFADPRISWLGQVETDGFHARVDVVVAPAVWAEPFGRVVVEALARGRGVIASRIGGLPEAANGGAVLVEPGDVTGLRAAMAQVLADPAFRRRRAPFQPVWTEASIIDAHRSLYGSVLASKASRAWADRSQR